MTLWPSFHSQGKFISDQREAYHYPRLNEEASLLFYFLSFSFCFFLPLFFSGFWQKALVVDQSPLTQANRRRYMTKLIMAAGQDNKLATAHSETMVRSVRDRRPWSYF
ncbi:G-type lectin S-receptor-like serine/threonine-protein kinase [Trichinella spiralis]|uniref:G-type lectin S-receptor-like serine/threonine-protein kinase n=1 Tax=Trichinella spiralis TaxID=6334 RepID=A0ABR3KTF4_TRISP